MVHGNTLDGQWMRYNDDNEYSIGIMDDIGTMDDNGYSIGTMHGNSPWIQYRYNDELQIFLV